MLSDDARKVYPVALATDRYIGLLRHGEVTGGPRFRGHTDDALTETGFGQMCATLDGRDGWTHVISSPLRRCSVFAADFARQSCIPLSFDHRLTEIHFGAWEGRTASELMADDAGALRRFWRSPRQNTPPGGEPLDGFQTRVLELWREIVSAPPGARVLMITHGGVIRVLLCHLTGVSLDKLQTFDVGLGSLYGVHVHEDGTQRLDASPPLGMSS